MTYRRPYDLSFHSGTAATQSQGDYFAAHFFGATQDSLTIETSRRVIKRGYSPDRIGGAREKLSSGAVTLSYGAHIGNDDIISAGIGGSFEKRRFALDFSNGHMVRSKSVSVEATWRHGPSWQLSSGYRDDIGSSGRSTLFRGIELAQGAGRTQRGPWAGLSFTPAGQKEAHRISFGLTVQSMQLSSGDGLALGAGTAHDGRIGFTTSWRFR